MRVLQLSFLVICGSFMVGCLPDDPVKSAGTADAQANQAATYFAASLSDIAMRAQVAITSDPAWVTTSFTDNTIGVPVRTQVCPTGVGSEVLQLTWIDGRTANGAFSLKGLGTQAGPLMSALRQRNAPETLASFTMPPSLELASGTILDIPADCGQLPIPRNAPVLVFRIGRPAPPTTAFNRTEFRTIACQENTIGRPAIEERMLTFNTDGSITQSVWRTRQLADCQAINTITAGDTNVLGGGGSAELNLAGLEAASQTLADNIRSRLEMDCSRLAVQSRTPGAGNDDVAPAIDATPLTIDTCARTARVSLEAQIEEIDIADARDQKILACTGTSLPIDATFLGRVSGVLSSTWTSGTATLVRTVDLKRLNKGGGVQGQRGLWAPAAVSCRGEQSFDVECDQVGGAPRLEARRSDQPWKSTGLAGYVTSKALGADWFGCGSFVGTCTSVTGGSVTTANPAYFTGTEVKEDNGVTAHRPIAGNSWADTEAFKPRITVTSVWEIGRNECVWFRRTMIAECPQTFDVAQENGDAPTVLTTDNPTPVALDPGGGGGSGEALSLYSTALANGEYPALVSVNMKKKKSWGRGTKRWTVTAGPGTGAYLKAWRTSGPSSLAAGAGAADIQTTLLNKDGVLERFRPAIVTNDGQQTLAVRQDGFAEPLRCGRSERRVHQWPVTTTQTVCTTAPCIPIIGRFCAWNAQPQTSCSDVVSETTINIVETTVREWSGYSYETGTWTKPKSTFVFDKPAPTVSYTNGAVGTPQYSLFPTIVVSDPWGGVNLGPWSRYEDIPTSIDVQLQ